MIFGDGITSVRIRVRLPGFASIIDGLGGPNGFADAVGITRNHAAVMRLRNVIPPMYWAAVVKAAAARQLDGVTYEALGAMYAQKRRPVEAAE